MPPSADGPVGVILTLNEVHHISACVASLRKFLSHVVVLDSGSTDGTVEMARLCGAAVIHHPFANYGAQRQAALDLIDGEWILFVDADERIPPALGEEIRALCRQGARDDALGGARIPRVNHIVTGPVQWGGFSPDFQLRLLRRSQASYAVDDLVHETAAVKGAIQDLETPLIHYNYHSWRQFHAKQMGYARLEARTTAAAGSVPAWELLKRLLHQFQYRYVTLSGWKDGVRGLWLAALLAWYYGFMPYALALFQGEENESA